VAKFPDSSGNSRITSTAMLKMGLLLPRVAGRDGVSARILINAAIG
jgi:hypothetical protein